MLQKTWTNPLAYIALHYIMCIRETWVTPITPHEIRGVGKASVVTLGFKNCPKKSEQDSLPRHTWHFGHGPSLLQALRATQQYPCLYPLDASNTLPAVVCDNKQCLESLLKVSGKGVGKIAHPLENLQLRVIKSVGVFTGVSWARASFRGSGLVFTTGPVAPASAARQAWLTLYVHCCLQSLRQASRAGCVPILWMKKPRSRDKVILKGDIPGIQPRFILTIML